MPNRITKELLQRYKAAKDVIVDIELFTRASSPENPSVLNLHEKLETELNAIRNIYDEYSMITSDYGGIDKNYLRHDKKFMTFLATYLPDISLDMEQPVYGGDQKKKRAKFTCKRKVSKRMTRKNKKHSRKGK